MIDDINNDIPMLDMGDENFKENLEFEIWSTHSCSDYRNDKERPYDGQLWTYDGERGRTEVKGLTMRDVTDCLIRAMLISSVSETYLSPDNWFKCWNFDKCIDGNPEPTQFLLDNQNESDYISTKVELGTWRPQDVYKINWENIDPLAIVQNLCCEMEKMMEIFPNVPTLKKEEL